VTSSSSSAASPGGFVDRILAEGFPPEAPLLRAVDADVQVRTRLDWQVRLIRWLIGVDLAAACLAVVVAALLAPGATSVPWTWLAFPAVWVAACGSTRSYEQRFLGTGSEEWRRVCDAALRLLAGSALLAYVLRLQLAELHGLLMFPLAVAFGLAFRGVARQVLHRQRVAGNCQHTVLVVGRERSCAELVRQLRREPRAGFSVVGACINRTQGPTVEGVPVVGTSAAIVEALRRTGADTVAVSAWSDFSQTQLRQLSWELEGSGVALVVASSITDVVGPRLNIRPVAGVPLLHVREPEFSGGRRVLKATVDRTLAAVVLLLTAPLLIGLAGAVRVSSPGPAFFRQRRAGADGRDFTMYKLRSMYVDAEERLTELQALNEAADGLLFKIRDDPRVTPIGRWLRRFSLDELPQLLNIVKGDMSLVGPRPPLPSEVAQYADDVRRRLLVRPGLTGLWQISGRSDLSWEESVRLDLHYVENWSLALDLQIVWKTVGAVLARKGAY
jgi:exopolysaccharide biosynthesis polyprenyl glycosylphosphotransferase